MYLSCKNICILALSIAPIWAQVPDAPVAPAAPMAPVAPIAPGMPGVPAAPIFGAATVVTQDEIDAWPAGTQVKVGQDFVDKATVRPQQIKGGSKIKLPSGRIINASGAEYDVWKDNNFIDAGAAAPAGGAAGNGKKPKPKPGDPNIARVRDMANLKINLNRFNAAQKKDDLENKIDAYDQLQDISNALAQAGVGEAEFARLAQENRLADEINTQAKLKNFLASHKSGVNLAREKLKEKEQKAREEAAKARAEQDKKEIIERIQRIIAHSDFKIPEAALKAAGVSNMERLLRDVKEFLENKTLLPADFANLSSTIKNKDSLANWFKEQEAKVKQYRKLHPVSAAPQEKTTEEQKSAQAEALKQAMARRRKRMAGKPTTLEKALEAQKRDAVSSLANELNVLGALKA